MPQYYLRNGDLRPEEFDDNSYKVLGYPSEEIARECLAAVNNLFNSREEACEASLLVSGQLQNYATICEARLQYKQPHQTQPDNSAQPSRPCIPQTEKVEMVDSDGEPLLPTEQNASGRKDDSSRANVPRITLIIH